jgi:mRNA-degrading endonuclease RelE of RelBE toxin-antitoxin system
VYKVRLRNRDAQRGKRGGHRVIYYVRAIDHILLIYVYSKTEQEDVSVAEIRRWIREAEETSE